MSDKADTLVIRDVAQLRVLSSSTRFIAFEELFATQRPMTPTQLAAFTRVSPASMSYHLRELERVGLVRRAEPGPDARERRWEAPAHVYDIVLSAFDDPAGRLALVDTYLSPLRSRVVTTLERRAESGGGAGDDSEMALGMGRLRLTLDEQRALRAEVAAVWARYEQVSRDHDAQDDGLRTAHYVWSLLADP
ncbi:Helix-turn-helix domain-containing protein [Klenkia soli]|uniref:Helix-turn-helix domain-containing protein n=1 Tax=Klenkia soli TaxID=1052260 RepID=A0A1H0EYM8_9ACTN|nr:helix-turn-helix domain-containing protein [Klenkia soli]SDN87389.1 Helix-turn-helix domain-containing protein [Klenkia soli]